MRLIAASALYFAIVFGAGFLLGPIRVFWLEPRYFTTPAGGIYAILLILFAAMPWLVNGRQGRIAP